MITYFCINETVVILDEKDFEGEEQIKFGFGVDTLFIPLKISETKLKLLECEFATLKIRNGKVLFYNNKIEECL